MTTINHPVADAISATLSSPNVTDSNLEAANVVDVLNDIAQAGFAIADALVAAAWVPLPPGSHFVVDGIDAGTADAVALRSRRTSRGIEVVEVISDRGDIFMLDKETELRIGPRAGDGAGPG